MTTEVKVYKQKYAHRLEVMIHNTEILTPEATYMMALIERWGLVMSMHDGEDSTGRQQTRPATVQEVVKKASEVTKITFDEARKNGWTITAPTIAEMDEISANDA